MQLRESPGSSENENVEGSTKSGAENSVPENLSMETESASGGEPIQGRQSHLTVHPAAFYSSRKSAVIPWSSQVRIATVRCNSKRCFPA
jgi:hypothetical protein